MTDLQTPPEGSAPQPTYPLRRAFLMLSIPFSVLLVFVIAVVLLYENPNTGNQIDTLDLIEARTEGIRSTDRSQVQLLMGAYGAAPDQWTEAQLASFRGLVERTGWPAELGPGGGVTAVRLTGASPSEWNQAERDGALKLLELFERYWFARPAPRR